MAGVPSFHVNSNGWGAALPVGMKTRSRSRSTEIVDHAFPAPVRGFVSFAHGMGSHVQRNFPVRISNARTMPRPVSTFQLSAIDDPVITKSPEIAGDDVT